MWSVSLQCATDPTAGLGGLSAGSGDSTIPSLASYIPPSTFNPSGGGTTCIDFMGYLYVVTHFPIASTLTLLSLATTPVGHTLPDAEDSLPSAAHHSCTATASTNIPPADVHAHGLPC